MSRSVSFDAASRPSRTLRACAAALALVFAAGLGGCAKPTFSMCPEKMPTGEPTALEAESFMNSTEAEYLRLVNLRERASWIRATNITHDTEAASSSADEAVMELTAKRSAMATRYDKLTLSPDLRRKFLLLKVGQTLPAPADPKKRTELATIATGMVAPIFLPFTRMDSTTNWTGSHPASWPIAARSGSPTFPQFTNWQG